MEKDGNRDQKLSPPAWDLSSLFPAKDSQALEKTLSDLEADAKLFSAAFKGKTRKLSGRDLGLAVASYEKIAETAMLVQSYAALLESESKDNAKAAAQLRARVRKATRQTLFFMLDLNKMKETDLLDKMSNPLLAGYAPWLRRVRSFRDHQLGDELERYVLEKKPVTEGAWRQIFDQTRESLRIDAGGRQLTQGEALHILNHSDDGALRRATFNALAGALEENADTFALIANTLVDLKSVSDKWREFERPEDSRHLLGQIEREDVDAMVKAVKESWPATAHRYYAWKAKRLGASRLHPADIIAPPLGLAPAHIPWDEAKKTVVEAFKKLSPETGDLARKFFDEGWIDAAPREGKALGSFCHLVTPSAHPFISMNYSGTPADVLALAREVGNGIRQMEANGQGYFKAMTLPPLSATAGIFGDMLAFRALIDKEDDLLQKRRLLAEKIEDMLERVSRPTAHFIFERKLHDERAAQGEVPAERIAQLWQETQKEFLGPAVNLDAVGAENLWMNVPDFIHAPFQSATLAFRDCFAAALFDEYGRTADKKDFAEKFTSLLKAGGTQRVEAVLENFGLDASDPQFWKKGLSVIERHVAELESLDRKIDAILKSKDVFKAAANDIVAPDAPEKKAKKNSPKGPRA